MVWSSGARGSHESDPQKTENHQIQQLDTCCIHTYKQTKNRQTHTYRHTHTDKQADTYRKIDKQTDTYTERQTSKHTYEQTHEHTCTRTPKSYREAPQNTKVMENRRLSLLAKSYASALSYMARVWALRKPFCNVGSNYKIPGGPDGGDPVATIKSTGIWKLQLSSLQGPEGCNSQVPNCLKVARSRIPGKVIVAARVVKTQTSIIRIHGSLSFCRFRTFPCVFLWFALGFDDPGCYYQVLGGLTVATRWQLSSPRGPESYNSQYSGNQKVATLKSPGA